MAYILLIDDSELALEYTKMMLQEAGHTVNATDDPRQFMQWVMGEPTPDLVMVDAVMPEVQGTELITRLRADPNPKIAAIPIILASALEDNDAANLGVLLLNKPFSEDELNNALSFALD